MTLAKLEEVLIRLIGSKFSDEVEGRVCLNNLNFWLDSEWILNPLFAGIVVDIQKGPVHLYRERVLVGHYKWLGLTKPSHRREVEVKEVLVELDVPVLRGVVQEHFLMKNNLTRVIDGNLLIHLEVH